MFKIQQQQQIFLGKQEINELSQTLQKQSQKERLALVRKQENELSKKQLEQLRKKKQEKEKEDLKLQKEQEYKEKLKKLQILEKQKQIAIEEAGKAQREAQIQQQLREQEQQNKEILQKQQIILAQERGKSALNWKKKEEFQRNGSQKKLLEKKKQVKELEEEKAHQLAQQHQEYLKKMEELGIKKENNFEQIEKIKHSKPKAKQINFATSHMHNPTNPFVVKHDESENPTNAMERAIIEEQNIQKQREKAQQRIMELQIREEQRKIAAGQKLKEQQQQMDKENILVNQKTNSEVENQHKQKVPTNISNLTGQQLIKQKQQKLATQFEKVFVLGKFCFAKSQQMFQDPAEQQEQEEMQEQNEKEEQEEKSLIQQEEQEPEKDENGDQTLDESSVKFWQDNESFLQNQLQDTLLENQIEESLQEPIPELQIVQESKDNETITSRSNQSSQNEFSLKQCAQQDSYQLTESNCSDTFLRNFSKMQAKGLDQNEGNENQSLINESKENQLLTNESKESESFNTQSDNINVFLKEQMEFLKNLDCQSKKLQGKIKDNQQETVHLLSEKDKLEENEDQASSLVQQFLKSAEQPKQLLNNQATIAPQLNFKKKIIQQELSNEKQNDQEEQSEIFDYSSSDNEIERELAFQQMTQKQNNYVMVDPDELQMQVEEDTDDIVCEPTQTLNIEQQKNCQLEINFVEDEKDNKNMTLADHFKKKKAQLQKRMESQKSQSKNKEPTGTRTKEEILKTRKEMMKPNYIKHQLENNSDEDLADTQKPNNGKNELMDRLAFGSKAQVTKKEMRTLTTKNYSQLPEIQKKNENEKKVKEFKERQQKVKELSKKVRNNLLFKVPDF